MAGNDSRESQHGAVLASLDRKVLDLRLILNRDLGSLYHTPWADIEQTEQGYHARLLEIRVDKEHTGRCRWKSIHGIRHQGLCGCLGSAASASCCLAAGWEATRQAAWPMVLPGEPGSYYARLMLDARESQSTIPLR
jgi:hypothetical protein